ncbi:ArsR/SmtB family transcription factor [Actinoplanes sp. HUAS TT8]|uniref:ArsR/SmtB family transcription factor n=1 Tax=Actinoplanes sp. HUAS TT8 TaxID=3447453 RepID=UPI003F51F049
MASRTPSPLAHPDLEDVDLLTVLSALSDPLRLDMVIRLINSPGLSCGGFYRDRTASVLTRHFRVLREAGIIHQSDIGVRRENVLRKEELDLRFPGLIDLIVKEAGRGTLQLPA